MVACGCCEIMCTENGINIRRIRKARMRRASLTERPMELYYSDKYFVLQEEDESLWINRENLSFTTKLGHEVVEDNPLLILLGRVYGFLGVLRLSSGGEPRLVFIRTQEFAGSLKGHDVYKITSVLTVPLESECDLEVEVCPCPKGKSTDTILFDATPSGSVPQPEPTTAGSAQPPVNAEGEPTPYQVAIILSKVKLPACPNGKKYTGVAGAAGGTAAQIRNEKTERRLLEEFHKMFQEADSFFYSHGYDLFNSVQRQTEISEEILAKNQQHTASSSPPNQSPQKTGETDRNQNEHCGELVSRRRTIIWRYADARFFWNNYMLQDLINAPDTSVQHWGTAIMQGSFQHRICQLDPSAARVTQNDSEAPSHLELILISRRSRYRAGTRYLRRGVDENGNVANYVETEQIMVFRGHMISFVLTRGSVPVYWSQPGYKYRPPIRLDRPIEEALAAYIKHVRDELKHYGDVVIVNLVEKSGKEKVLEEAYRKCLLNHNSETVTYITFDFHDKCRGMKYDNVKILTDSVADITKNMGYCWVDAFGTVMKQTGAFRVNCVDCLDRTNIVQTALAKEVLCHQLSKVGLLLPEIGLSENIKRNFLEMWANNGDVLSMQYAGTNALKGDFTRTGERKFTGVMRDGMNSANRYIHNRLKDGHRQACIDLILGDSISVSEEELALGKDSDERGVTIEVVTQMLEDVRHCLVPIQSVVLGSWGLVNATNNDVIASVDVDTILVLTDLDCFIATYDCTLDTIARSTRIRLQAVTSIELISEPVQQNSVANVWGLLGSGGVNPHTYIPSLKLHFTAEDDTKDYFHFRSSTFSTFNNYVTQISHPDELMEALKMLAESIKAAAFSSHNMVIPITQGVASSSKGGQRGLPGINSWMPRWNTGSSSQAASQQESGEPLSRKFTPASMQRFTPNFLKKKRTTAQGGDEEDLGTKPLGAIPSSETTVPQTLLIPSTVLSSCGDTDSTTSSTMIMLHGAARTPMETSSTSLVSSGADLRDMYIASCGIVSVHSRSAPIPDAIVSPFELRATPGVSPVTPVLDISQDVTPTSTETNASLRLPIPHDMLHRHRYSLPTNSLGLSTILNKNSGGGGARSTTPEIRITEEPTQTPSGLCPSMGPTAAQKRMSRSSEDVNKISSITAGVKMFNTAFINKVPTTLKNKLVPSTHNQDGRSTSDQDIFSSVANMRGSHSENAIRDGNPAQRRDPSSPFGKLAKGVQTIGSNFDPRKLRMNFRPPASQPDPQVEVDPELVEKLKSSKSRIIDI